MTVPQARPPWGGAGAAQGSPQQPQPQPSDFQNAQMNQAARQAAMTQQPQPPPQKAGAIQLLSDETRTIEAAAPEEPPAEKPQHAPRPKVRTTAQIGHMLVTPDDRGRRQQQQQLGEPLTVVPQAYVQVQWEMPQAIMVGGGGGGGVMPHSMTVALFRLGQLSNEHSIVRKGLRESKDMRRTDRGTVSGRIRFYAPKGVGRFIFRIYDDEDPVCTLSTSNDFAVSPSYADVVPVIKFVLAQLKEKRTTMNALQQLPMLLASIPFPKQQGGPWGNMAWEAIKLSQKQLEVAEAEAAKLKLSKEELLEKIMVQVEYYFSAENWDADDWLREQAEGDPSGQGLIALKQIGGFKMVKQLTTQAMTLRRAAMSSPKLYVGIISGETYGVRARNASDEPWSEFDLALLDEEEAADGGANEEEEEEEAKRAMFAERAKATRRVASVHARLRAILCSAQRNEGLMSKLLRREHCQQIREWQSLYCPFARRYYGTKDELLDSHADYLGFAPESVPLFPPGQAVPPPLRPFLGSIAASMQRFTEEMELTQQSSQERETLRRRLQDGLIAKGCAQPNSWRGRSHILTSASGLCGAGWSRPIRS